jgi:RNA polymerase sigma-70 factor (ECF subfamily)
MGHPTKHDSGEAISFEAAYEDNFQAIYRFGHRLLGDPEQALDLTQEVFLRLHANLDGGSPIQDIKPWLYRAATNLSYDWLRRNARFRKIPINPVERAAPDAEQKLIAAERAQAVRRALGELPVRDRVLLNLYQNELSYEEISKASGIRRSSVGKLVSRALRRLAKRLENGEKS